MDRHSREGGAGPHQDWDPGPHQDWDAPPRPPRGNDFVRIVIPAAFSPRESGEGIHVATVKVKMGPRFRGDDGSTVTRTRSVTGTTPVL
jgi:hypothetical protein